MRMYIRQRLSKYLFRTASLLITSLEWLFMLCKICLWFHLVNDLRFQTWHIFAFHSIQFEKVSVSIHQRTVHLRVKYENWIIPSWQARISRLIQSKISSGRSLMTIKVIIRRDLKNRHIPYVVDQWDRSTTRACLRTKRDRLRNRSNFSRFSARWTDYQ